MIETVVVVGIWIAVWRILVGLFERENPGVEPLGIILPIELPVEWDDIAVEEED